MSDRPVDKRISVLQLELEFETILFHNKIWKTKAHINTMNICAYFRGKNNHSRGATIVTRIINNDYKIMVIVKYRFALINLEIIFYALFMIWFIDI